MFYDSQYYSFQFYGPVTLNHADVDMQPIDWSWGQPVPNAAQQSQPSTGHAFRAWGSTSQVNSATNGLAPAPQQSDAAPQPHQRLSVAGRKRSRQEMADTLDDDSPAESPPSHPLASSSHATTPKGEPIWGPGMTLIYPDDPAYTAMVGANSQTGTWAEELAERMRSNSLEDNNAAKRPAIDSRKSMRLDREAARVDDVQATILSESHVRKPSAPDDHIIDEATRALGIGWNAIPSNPSLDEACRGWARYIENSHPLQGVKVVWKNKSLPAYLVSAVTRDQGGFSGSPGYYLFNEELSQGKLIAKSWGRALDNLRSTPIVFDGDEVYDINSYQQPTMAMDAIPTGGPAPVLVNGGMDLDN